MASAHGTFGKRAIAWRYFSEHKKINADGEQFADDFDSEVNLLVVSKELRGKQFGYKLMRHYLDWCKENDIADSFLWTELSCTYTFYERFGYQRYGYFHSDQLTAGDTVRDNGLIYAMDIQQFKEQSAARMKT